MLTNDRFNRPNSALDLNSGYYQAPNGVYFNTTFSITAWFYARQISNGEPLLDFGFINSGFPNIMLYLTFSSSGSPHTRISDVSGTRYEVIPNIPTPLFSWTHMVSTFNGSFLNLYLNGTLLGSTPSAYPPNIVRTSNFIGKSYYSFNTMANAIFDEIRFYNRALSQIEIGQLMSLNV